MSHKHTSSLPMPVSSASNLPRAVARTPSNPGSVPQNGGKLPKSIAAPLQQSRLPVRSFTPPSQGKQVESIAEENGNRTMTANTSRFRQRQNSLFEMVEPNAVAQGQQLAPSLPPPRPIRPASLVLDGEPISTAAGEFPSPPNSPDAIALPSGQSGYGPEARPKSAVASPNQNNQQGLPIMHKTRSRASTNDRQAASRPHSLVLNSEPPTEEQEREAERVLRRELLSRLSRVYGERVFEFVDADSIVHMGAEGTTQTDTAAAPVSVPSPPMERSNSSASDRKQKRGFFGFKSRKTPENKTVPLPNSSTPSVPIVPLVFGRRLRDLPKAATCMTYIGANQEHVLPIVIFATVEEMYRSGLRNPSLFRRVGDAAKIDALVHAYNTAPLFGDKVPLDQEDIVTVAGLFRRFLREMPEPVFDQRLSQLFINACLRLNVNTQSRIGAAQTILRFLPRSNFSLFVYLIAFLGQLVQSPGAQLTCEEISVLLGPAIMAPRRDIDPAGSTTKMVSSSSLSQHIQDNISPQAKKDAQAGLGWILQNWPAICGPAIDLTNQGRSSRPTSGVSVQQDEINTKVFSSNSTSASEPSIVASSSTSEMPVAKTNRYVVNDLGSSESPNATWRSNFDPSKRAVIQPAPRLRSSQGSLERLDASQIVSPVSPLPAQPASTEPVRALEAYVSTNEPANESAKLDHATPVPSGTLAPPSTGPQRASVPPFSDLLPAEGITQRSSIASTIEPVLPLQSKPRGPRRISSLVEELQRRYDEAEMTSERHKSANEDLLRQLAEQEQKHGAEKESFTSERSTLRGQLEATTQELAELRIQFRQAAERKAQEEKELHDKHKQDDEALQHWKGLAEKSQREAQTAREGVSAELERLIKIVKDVTADRDLANHRLRKIRKALSQDIEGSLHGSSRESLKVGT